MLADYFDNPAAQPFADKHIKVSMLDLDGVLYVAKNEKIQLVSAPLWIRRMPQPALLLGDLDCLHHTALLVTDKLFLK